MGCRCGLPLHFDSRTVRLCPALCPHRGLGWKESKQAESKLTASTFTLGQLNRALTCAQGLMETGAALDTNCPRAGRQTHRAQQGLVKGLGHCFCPAGLVAASFLCHTGLRQQVFGSPSPSDETAFKAQASPKTLCAHNILLFAPWQIHFNIF